MRGNVYATDATQKDLDKASPRCFRSPSMNQGIAIAGERVYLNFESGSFEFDGRNGPAATNVIPGLHTAKLDSLTELLDQ